MPDAVTLTIDGRPASVRAGASVAAAILGTGQAAMRASVEGAPRGPLCAMGICFECRVTIDGIPHRLACQTLCQPGMEVRTGEKQGLGAGGWGLGEGAALRAGRLEEPGLGAGGGERAALRAGRGEEPGLGTADETYRFDVLVIGAGPAGMAAAAAAAEAGARAGVVDDNPEPGGQIWRGGAGPAPSPLAARWFERFHAGAVAVLSRTRVFDAPAPSILAAERDGRMLELQYGKLVLATGARERFLPFPGWTLPNVMGAGGLQALAKAGLPLAGKRVVVAGSGPLLLAVAAYLRGHGASVPVVAEQAPRTRVAAFALRLAAHPAKLAEAVRLRLHLAGTRYVTNCWPVRAEGDGRVAAVVLGGPGGESRHACDYLACGFGLVPNVELALLLGCAVEAGRVRVDPWQQTTLENVYSAGEPTGIGGVDLALAEGEIAGFAAAGARDRGRPLFHARAAAARFASRLDAAFALRRELAALAAPETIVCRCEDVALGRIAACDNRRAAKLYTRCGMGPCQGRVCGPALEFLLGWQGDSIRPPLFPVAVEQLAGSEPTAGTAG